MNENASGPKQQTEFTQVRELTLDQRVARLEDQRNMLGRAIAQQDERINTLYREIEYLRQASYGMQHQTFMQHRIFKPGAEARSYAHPAGGSTHPAAGVSYPAGGGLFEFNPQFYREQFPTPEIGTAMLLTRLLENQWSSNLLVEWLHELYMRVYCSELRALTPGDYVQITNQLQGLINQKTKQK